MREVNLSDLKPGDLVGLDWSDAWSDRGVPLRQKDYDMIWHEVGIFLYFAGRRTKHIILAYNKAPGSIEEWTITAIPTSLVKRVFLVERKYIQQVLPGVLRKLKKKVRFKVPQKLILTNHNPVATWELKI